MDKKPLIVVSICAVVLLFLGLLSNVVGYQSVKLTAMNGSPLFNVRTQRATNQQQNILTSQYLGMGKGNELYGLIPSINSEKILLQKALKRLQGMDDATFTKFLENVPYWLRTQDKYKEVNVPQLIFTFHILRENPIAFEQYFAKNNKDLTPNNHPSVYAWFPGCIISQIITFIYNIVGFILLFFALLFIPTSSNPSCDICPLLHQ